MSGASGLIGSALVPALRADGHDVMRLVRRRADRRRRDSLGSGSGRARRRAPRRHRRDRQSERGRTSGSAGPMRRQREILESRTIDDQPVRGRTAAALDPRPSVIRLRVGDRRLRRSRRRDPDRGVGAQDRASSRRSMRAWEAAAAPAREAGIRVVQLPSGHRPVERTVGRSSGCFRSFKLGLGGRIGERRSSGAAGSGWPTSSARIPASHSTQRRRADPVNVAAPNPVTSRQFAKALGSALSTARRSSRHQASRSGRSSGRRAKRCFSRASARSRRGS